MTDFSPKQLVGKLMAYAPRTVPHGRPVNAFANLHRMDSALAPIALMDEGSPSIRDGVRFCLPHRYLHGPERGGGTHSILQHPLVKPLHQVGCGLIVYIPQAGHHAWRSGVHQSSRQTGQPFASDFLPQSWMAAG